MNLGLLEIPSSLKKVLTFFRERRNNTGVNAITPYHQIQVVGTETDISVAITPKGKGAITAQVPDNTVSGGNARGSNAVDLQTRRFSASNVASGDNSTISGGAFNTASNSSAVVSGGGLNTASGASSFIGGGFSNSASQSFSSVAGGNANSATGEGSTVSGGIVNTASGAHSTIPGGSRATTNGIDGLWAYGFSGESLGRNQMSFCGLRKTTASTAATRLTTNAATESITNQLTLRNNSAFLVSGRIVAWDTVAATAAAWEFQNVLITRAATAASTTLVGTRDVVLLNSNMAATPLISLMADTTNGALAVTVTPGSTNTTRWTCVLHAIETMT